MREFISLRHLQPATVPLFAFFYYYIPRHPVLENFRVVFDALARTTNGKLLNDIQLPGPKIEADLYDIVLRFRVGRIALKADVVKMFRQVRIRPEE